MTSYPALSRLSYNVTGAAPFDSLEPLPPYTRFTLFLPNTLIFGFALTSSLLSGVANGSAPSFFNSTIPSSTISSFSAFAAASTSLLFA